MWPMINETPLALQNPIMQIQALNIKQINLSKLCFRPKNILLEN